MGWTKKQREEVSQILIRHGAMDLPHALAAIERATTTINPFASLNTIIDATVMDELKKKVLNHNLDIFRRKLKEAQQNAH